MNVTRDQCLLGDLGAAEAEPFLGGDAEILEDLQVHVAKDELLGEILGADDYRQILRADAARCRQRNERGASERCDRRALDQCSSGHV